MHGIWVAGYRSSGYFKCLWWTTTVKLATGLLKRRALWELGLELSMQVTSEIGRRCLGSRVIGELTRLPGQLETENLVVYSTVTIVQSTSRVGRMVSMDFEVVSLGLESRESENRDTGLVTSRITKLKQGTWVLWSLALMKQGTWPVFSRTPKQVRNFTA